MMPEVPKTLTSLLPSPSRFKFLPTAMLALATLLASTPLFSQGTTATLGGTVTDASGAVIPNAQVTLKSETSDDKRTTTSNGSGVFSFSGVPSGTYDVTIAAPGFKGFQQNAVHLDPGDTRSVRDIHLSAGGANDVVDVTSGSDSINLDSGEQSSLISAQQIEHLSVEGRDVTELFKILPGFAISRGGGGNIDNQTYDPSQVSVNGALGSYAANGTPINGVSLLSDGADVTDPGNFGGAVQNINYEQVAEVKVQTSSFTADGARGPIVVNAVGKSGGNKYHGSLYTYARTSQLNSTDWIANFLQQQKPPDRQVYPGGTFGGPIAIPGLSFNKSKRLTFFVGAEDYAQRNAYAYGSAAGAVLTALVPTAGMRAGDYSKEQLQQYLGTAYTPTINGCSGSDANLCTIPTTGPNGQALVNGNISAFLDPLSSVILNGMPLPNTASNGTYNWTNTNLVDNNLYQAKARVDDHFSDKVQLFGVYSIERGKNGVPQAEYYSPRGNLGGINIPGGGLVSTVDSQIASLNLTTTFSPTITNEFYAAGIYFRQNFAPKNLAATQGNPYQGLFNNGSTVQPTLEDYGNDGLPLSRLPDGSFGGIYAQKVIRTFGDNLTKVLGRHTVRTGLFYQLDSNHQVTPFVNTNGTVNLYYFPETYTDPVAGLVHNTGPNTGAANNGTGGNYLANFAEGHIFQYNQTNFAPAPNLFFYNLAGYVQDHWRISQRLTLDLGIRLEHFTPWGDSHGIGVPVFSAAAYAAGTNPAFPGFTYHSIDKNVPVTGLGTRWAYVEPRVGFAWDAYGGGKTIVRGGFGIYRAHDSSNDAESAVSAVLGSRTAYLNGPINLSSISSQAANFTSPSGFSNDTNGYGFMANDDEQPQVKTYNLSVDQRLPGNMLLEVSYVGNNSNHILNNGSSQNTNLADINSLPIGSLFQPQPNSRQDLFDQGLLQVGKVYPTFTPPGQTGNNLTVGGLDQAHIDSFKKYPRYNHLYVPQHNLYANYNGLQTALAKQQGKATFGVNYTFSKALAVLGGFNNGYPADAFNLRNDYMEPSYDRRHIFNAFYSYQFGNVVKNKLIGIAANGWEASGISNYQSGANLLAINTPNFGLSGNIAIANGADAGPGRGTCQAGDPTPNNLNPSCQLAINNTNILGTPDVNLQPLLVGNPAAGRGKHQYVNGNAFGVPSIGTNGAYRYGFLPGPGFFNTDLTVAKRFAVTEKTSVQLKVAAFNAINHGNNSFTSVRANDYALNFNQNTPQTSVNAGLNNDRNVNAGFGSAPLREGRRIMELALRFDF